MAGARPPLIEGAGEFFDTLVRIRADCDQRLIDACLARCAFFHSTLSRFDDTSDVGRINAAAGRRVRAAPTTARLVSLALEYSRLTGVSLTSRWAWCSSSGTSRRVGFL